MNTEIKVSVIRRSGPFVDYDGINRLGLWSGRITVFFDGNRRWSKTYSAERITKEDALEDAHRMRNYTLMGWGEKELS